MVSQIQRIKPKRHRLNEANCDFLDNNDKTSYSEVDFKFASAKKTAFFCLRP